MCAFYILVAVLTVLTASVCKKAECFAAAVAAAHGTYIYNEKMACCTADALCIAQHVQKCLLTI